MISDKTLVSASLRATCGGDVAREARAPVKERVRKNKEHLYNLPIEVLHLILIHQESDILNNPLATLQTNTTFAPQSAPWSAPQSEGPAHRGERCCCNKVAKINGLGGSCLKSLRLRLLARCGSKSAQIVPKRS